MKELIVVCGIIKIQDTYLIARRSGAIDAGYWEFPGGKVEAGETLEQAIARELYEELHVQVKAEKKLCQIVDQRPDVVLQVHAFLCTLLNGTPRMHVHDALRYVKAEELSNYRFQPADQPILDAVQNKKEETAFP